MSRDEFLSMFREDVIRLSRYIPWFEKKSGNDVSKYYEDGDKMKHTLSFPVYDSILLAFLNDASTTVFMEQNYHYFYTRNQIHGYEDELKLIETADIMHMEVLQCILSRYIFGGMTKAYLWKDGVDHKVFLSILKKARQIIEFWEQPLVIEDEILPEDGEEMEEFGEAGYGEETEESVDAEYQEETEESVEIEYGEETEEPVEAEYEAETEEPVEAEIEEEIEEPVEAESEEETEEAVEAEIEEEVEEPAEAEYEAEAEELAESEPEEEIEEPAEAEYEAEAEEPVEAEYEEEVEEPVEPSTKKKRKKRKP